MERNVSSTGTLFFLILMNFLEFADSESFNNVLPTFPVPIRNELSKATTRGCVGTYGETAARAYFLHNRKAGGTTIRKWIGHQQICQHHFIGFVEEAMVFNVSRLGERGTVFISAIREPISRIFSSYHFEGDGTFPQWVEKVQSDRTRGRVGRVWMEVQNYYVQRFSGYRWRGKGSQWGNASSVDESAPDWEFLYQRAVKVLEQFDLIILVEDFHNQSAVQLGLSQLGVSSHIADEKGTHLGHEKIPSRKGPKKEVTLSEEEDRVLREWNKWDTRLYDYAKKLIKDRMEHARALWYQSNETAYHPKLEECVSNIGEKWGEPISRQASRGFRCKHR